MQSGNKSKGSEQTLSPQVKKGRLWSKSWRLLIAILVSPIFFLIALYTNALFTTFDASPLHDCASPTFYDRNNHIFHMQLNKDQQWCLPVAYENMSPHIIAATLAAEDKRFFSHQGIDYPRMLRASWSNITNARIISGASTLSMQLARLSHPRKRRSWAYKWRQMTQAISMERDYSKKWILEHYLNFAPYGGNIIGIEAASRFYFGKSNSLLSQKEAALLAAIPQSPVRLRPDRYPENARIRQIRILKQMKLPTENIALFTPRKRTTQEHPLAFIKSSFHYQQLVPKTVNQKNIRTYLDLSLQRKVNDILTTRCRQLNGINDAAAVVINNRNGQLHALVGTLDFHKTGDGQVNAATSNRSSGSTLKPFIYLQAIDKGIITPGTFINDSPLSELTHYRPGNFDGLFHGQVSASKALATSLNTPAVRLLQSSGVENLLRSLRQIGLSSLTRNSSHYGLSLALGGAEVSLLELTNAYAGLARGGRFFPYSTIPGQQYKETKLFRPGSIELLTGMLSSQHLPAHPQNQIAWKTGTSNGLRDAWCIAYTSDWTVGVWFGNKSGAPSPDLIGSYSARPALEDIFTILLENRIHLFPEQKFTEEFTINGRLNRKVIGLPLVSQIEKAQQETPMITSPTTGTYYCTGDTIELELLNSSTAKVTWFINDLPLPKSEVSVWHQFPPGRHKISCISTTLQSAPEIIITVKKIQR